MNSLNESVIFSSSIFHTEIENSAELIPHIQKIKLENPSVKLSNMGGWQSPSYANPPHEFMKSTINTIREYVIAIYKRYGINGNAELINYWFNVNEKHSYNIAHRHGSCFYSAVLYLKTPENSGNLVFERADLADVWINYEKFENPENWAKYWVEPIVNRCVIFPSYLPHRVEQNLSDEERISIAFNFK